MTTIFEIAETALAPLGVPYAQNTYLTVSGAALPDTYLVYQVITGAPAQHADNIETGRVYRVQVTIITRNSLASAPNVDGAMLAAGFKKGPERELPRDQYSGHIGLAKDYLYLKEA